MQIEQELQKFNLPDAAITAMSEQYRPLKIDSIDDRAGYIAVKEARLTVKGKRVDVEKRRKELKEDSLRYGKAVDAEAKRITTLLEPIEAYLSLQESWFDTEKERLKQEAARQKQEKLQGRIDALKEYNQAMNIVALEAMSDKDFAEMLETAKIEFEFELDRQRVLEIERQEVAEQEKQRLAAIAAEQEIERIRLAEIARVQAEKEANIKAEQEKIIAQQKAIEDIEQSRLRKIAEDKRIEEAKKEAVEQERIRLQEESERERLAEVRRKALIPETEKLSAFATEVFDLADRTPQQLACGKEARLRLLSVCAWLRVELEMLTKETGETP